MTIETKQSFASSAVRGVAAIFLAGVAIVGPMLEIGHNNGVSNSISLDCGTPGYEDQCKADEALPVFSGKDIAGTLVVPGLLAYLAAGRRKHHN